MNLEKAKQQQKTLQEIIDSLEVTLYRVRSKYSRYVKEVREPLDSNICDTLEDEDFTLVFNTPPAFPEENNEYYYFKDEKVAQGYAEGLYEIEDGVVSATQIDLDNKGIHMLGKHFKKEAK